MILTKSSNIDDYSKSGGGKSLKLFELIQANIQVPPFIVASNEFFHAYLKDTGILDQVSSITAPKEDSLRIENLFSETPLPVPLAKLLEEQLQENNLLGQKLAIRSSGIDEDSTDHSFAGMFSSYLFQEKFEDIELSLRMCWASAYGIRALEYRRKNGLSLSNIKMGVVLQKMINSSISGVMFTRNPMDAFDRENIIIDSLFGQCEGLVSGLLDADNYIVSRTTLTSKSTIAEKESQLVQAKDAAGLETRALDAEMAKSSSLSEEQVKSIAQLGLKLEKHFQMPLDVEWAIEDDELYIVQSRPITTLPVDAFYSSEINGTYATLWDNSNIVESFSGVTTPLTFSGTKKAYAIVYRQTCRLLGVPEKIIEDYDEQFENMLGLIKGRVYYNLINWYKLLLLMPGSSSSKSFMETMMGVKEDLHEKHQKLFDFVEDVPKYGILKKLQVFGKLTYYFFRIDSMVAKFSKNFDLIYQEYNSTDFTKRPLKELKNMYIHWEKNITYNWKPPIINDFLVMIFFGALKSMTEKWIKTDQDSVSLQNDLLCGQGDLDSALPVKTLMKIAGIIDKNDDQRQFIQNHSPEQLWAALQSGEQPEIYKLITDYLHLYGFRCNNEQKLEEKDLNDDPSFLFSNLQSYLRMKNYSVEKMSEREQAIKLNAEELVKKQLSGIKRSIYFWTLKHARNAVKNRENLRFLRTKAFGVSRKLFRAVGAHLANLNVIDKQEDVFFLTLDELWDFIEGKAESLYLSQLATLRKNEYESNLQAQDPPDRFLTYGAAGISFRSSNILNSGDLLKDQIRVSDDPNVLLGISCCPGVVTGVVVVAENIEQASNLNGEILVTKRTDPGWVPLYPSCSGLIIERGSLLSHSAVIARELGLPTVVGVSGGLMSRLKTGDRVELNATRGEVRILNDED